MSSPEVSVVMPVLNCPEIEDQLGALSGQTFSGRWEVIVADNGSTDGTRDRARRWRDRLPDLRVIDASAQRGGDAARNIGTVAARAARIAYCDADDVVCPQWLEHLGPALDGEPMATGPIDLTRLNRDTVIAWRPTVRWEALPSWHRYLPAALTCNLAVRREVHEALGGFQAPAIGADFRFVWRAQLSGWRLGFAPGALVHRREPTTWSAYLRRSYRYGSHEPALYREFRDEGMPRSSTVVALARWAALTGGAPVLALPRWRYAWLDTAGLRAGRLVGSLRDRVLYL